MNFQKLLKNPVAVIVLCVIAGLFLYFNTIVPIVFPDSNGEILPESTESIGEISEIPQDTTLSNAYQNTPADSSHISMLKKIGWRRTGERDPFINEKRKGPRLTVDTLSGNDTTQTQPPVELPAKPAQPSPAILRAISIGSHTKVALIGTRELHEGDRFVLGRVLKIGPDSVLIESATGLRTIHLKK